MKKLIYDEVARCQAASQQKKLFHISSFMRFAFIFSEYTPLLFQKSPWKYASTISIRQCKRKVVIYLFNYDWFKSIFFMLNMAFEVLLSAIFVK